MPPNSQELELPSRLTKLLLEGLFVITTAVAIFLIIALSTYHSDDPGWSYFGAEVAIKNAGGKTGAWIADILVLFFGYIAYLFPLVFIYRTGLFFTKRQEYSEIDWAGGVIFFIGLVLLFLSLCGLTTLHTTVLDSIYPQGAGGYLGQILNLSFVPSFGVAGAKLIYIALFFIGGTFVTSISWLKVTEAIGHLVLIKLPLLFAKGAKHFWPFLNNIPRSLRFRRSKKTRESAPPEQHTIDLPETPVYPKKEEPVFSPLDTSEIAEFEPLEDIVQAPSVKPSINIKTPKTQVEQSPRVIKEKQKKLFQSDSDLPEITSLLNAPSEVKKGYSREVLEKLSRLLELKLLDFKVEVTVTDVLPGPVVTRFEIEPKPGTKVNTINNLSKDIARSLAVVSVRVVEVIEGKSVIGIEIPNKNRETVFFSEVVGSEQFDHSKSPLTLVLGKDIGGEPIVADLAKMPHLLVAGTTGSGKSVGVNAMLLSLLFKSTPDDVRLILIDPKMLELSVYEGIPHLLSPVITDMKDASNSLRWCVGEMERRYKLMSRLGVRNIAGYNKKVLDAEKAGEPMLDPLYNPDESLEGEAGRPALSTLPFIVIVIDEFADMMMVVGKKVEELIARIAQKARAAGIHLVLATQRPSVDVITGLIKANVPTRIAFQVSSKIDSRTILDQGGAEQLLGQGDMLFLPPGTSLLTRVHGAFVDDDEVHRVVAAWKERGEPDYIEDLTSEGESIEIPGIASESQEDNPESDPLYDEAVAFVCETRKASISSVQRKLRIGYNRAARMIETMEAAGVVSPMSASGQREVLAPPPR
ncbi:MAG: DNA translocase FtsK 4TM domain-containing protein [Cellvibrionales bacterium]|nr:DNA translocase FtsK 4TM domain-containing protein [Cellvibrionales bacterium]